MKHFLLWSGLLTASAFAWGCADEATPNASRYGSEDEAEDDDMDEGRADGSDSDQDGSEQNVRGSGKADGGIRNVADGGSRSDAAKPPANGGKDARDAANNADDSDEGGRGDAAQGPFIPSGPNRADGFESVAPPLGDPLDPEDGTSVSPAPPSGWVWYEIEGTICRDGSPNGLYVHHAGSDNLLIYLEGGGACTSPDFCAYNPKNVNEVLAGDGQTLLGSVGGAVPGRQQPGGQGIFDLNNAANPFKTWSMVYIPYCTGDVHFGTRRDVQVPNVAGVQQFVGYRNMQKFVGRVVPTFRDEVRRVVLTGASAGGFGASLNYSMVQDAFGDDAQVMVLNDSGPSFADEHLPVCMQKRWRALWDLDAAFPEDCSECRQADGGGLGLYANFLEKKHPNFTYAIISSMQDEVIRAFFSSSLDNCSSFESASPVPAALGLTFDGATYVAGLTELRSSQVGSGSFASYYINGLFTSTWHQHIFRPRFYEAAQGSTTIAQWVTDFINGKMTQVGP